MQEQPYSIEHRKFNLINLITQLEDSDTLAAIEALLIQPQIEISVDEPEEEISDETKELLTQRLENHRNAPEKAKPWDEVEQRLMKKHGYEV